MSVRALAWSSNSGSVGWGLRRMPDVRRPEVISGADFVLEWNDSRQVLKKHQRQLFSLCEYSNLFETVLGQVGTSTPPTHGPLDSIIKIQPRFGVTWLARNLNAISVKPYWCKIWILFGELIKLCHMDHMIWLSRFGLSYYKLWTLVWFG